MSTALALGAIGLLLAWLLLTRWLAARSARKARQAARASAPAGGDR